MRFLPIERPSLEEAVAFAAAIQPGPLQAFLLARVAAAGWKRTLPAVLAPLLSDIPIATLAVLGLYQLAVSVPRLSVRGCNAAAVARQGPADAFLALQVGSG